MSFRTILAVLLACLSLSNLSIGYFSIDESLQITVWSLSQTSPAQKFSKEIYKKMAEGRGISNLSQRQQLFLILYWKIPNSPETLQFLPHLYLAQSRSAKAGYS